MQYFSKTLLWIVLLPIFASAQTNYKPGYIVTLKGDTLKGFIDYREWEKNPKQVSFKAKTEDNQPEEVTPGNTAAFGVTGLEYYERYAVSVSMDRLEIENISSKEDPTNATTDIVFLKILTRGGHVSLYSYRDNIKSRFYLSESGNSQQPEELGYHAHYNGDLTNTIEYTRRYRTQLQYEAQKNNVSGLEKIINESRYSADDLVKIVSKINGSSDQQMVSKSLYGTRWFAGAGIFYNDMVFTGGVEYPDSYTAFPKVSAGIDLFTNKNTQQLLFRFEINLTGDQHSSSNSYQQSELKVQQYTASLVPQVYYNFYNGEKLKIFAGGGMAFNFSTYPTRYEISQQGIDLTPTKQNNFPDYHSVWQSFLIKAGVSIGKKVEFYVGYSPSTTLTDNYTSFSGDVVSYQAGINYLFGVK